MSRVSSVLSALGTTVVLFLSCSNVVESGDTAVKVYAKVNNSLWLNCSLLSTSVPPDRVSWYYNNQPVGNRAVAFVTYREDTKTLVLNISAVTLSDSGLYHCGYQSPGSFIVINKYAIVVGDVPQRVETHKCYKLRYPPSIRIWWPHLRTQSHKLDLKYTVFFCKSMKPHYCLKLHKDYNSTKNCTDITAAANPNSNFFCNLTPVAKKLFPNLYSDSTDIQNQKLCTWIQAKNALGTSDSRRRCCDLLQNIECNRPSNLSSTATTERQLKILWDVPNEVSATSFAMFYTILYSAKGSTSNMTVTVNPSLALSYTIIRLRPYTEYTIYVTCGINNFDFGKFAGPVTITTLEEAPGSAPSIQLWMPVAKNGTKRSVKISWKLPPKELWRGKPERIVVEYWKGSSDNSNNTELQRITVNNVFAKSVVLEDLDLTANYTAVVRLCTGGGCSNVSSPVIIPAEKVKDQKHNDNLGPDTTLAIALGVGIGVGLPVACIVIVVVTYVFYRQRKGPRARPLTDVLDNLEVYVDQYEQPAPVRRDSDYESDPPGSGHQPLLADEKPASSDNSSHRTSATGYQAPGDGTQQTTSDNERYVLLGNKSNQASKRNCPSLDRTDVRVS